MDAEESLGLSQAWRGCAFVGEGWASRSGANMCH